MATSLAVTNNRDYLVCSGGAAASSGVDEWKATSQLDVQIEFSGQTAANFADDSRTQYSVSADAPFEVNSNTGAITAKECSLLGSGPMSGTVTVTFEGQSLNATVAVDIGKFKSMAVVTSAYPDTNSGVSVTKLSKIECTIPTVYQQAVLDVDMTIEYGDAAAEVTKRLSRTQPGLTYSVDPVSAGLSIGSADAVASATAAGNFEISANFATKTTSTPFAITVDDTMVKVASLSGLKLNRGETLRGRIGTIDTVTVGATLSDGRKVLPGQIPSGLLKYSSHLECVSFDNDLVGTIKLNDNCDRAATVEAQACYSSPRNVLGGTTGVYGNLRPTEPFDVDLGATSQTAIPQCVGGSSISVPIRINTDGKLLESFDISLQLDSQLLSFVENSEEKSDQVKSNSADYSLSVGQPTPDASAKPKGHATAHRHIDATIHRCTDTSIHRYIEK